MLRCLLVIFLWVSWSVLASAEPLRVAVASNFLMPAKQIIAKFERISGEEVTVSSGSTAKMYAQIINGAPYGVLLAANAREPKRLEMEGRAVAGSRFTYANGRLVLWSRNPDLVTAETAADLVGRRAFTRLAVANPKTAPYGAAAMQTMRALGLEPNTLRSSLVRGENVSQTYQFVASGNADLGFVALSQVTGPGRPAGGSHWVVPSALHEPIEQQAVLLTRAEHDATARAFLDYLRSPEVVALILGFGYAEE